MKAVFRDGTTIPIMGEYPIREGVIDCLPDYLQYELNPSDEAKNFIDIHKQVMEHNVSGDRLLTDKKAMSKLQMEFYDTAAKLYQKMDENDKAGGGIHWLRIYRNFDYDMKQISSTGKNMLYVGAGNCRHAFMFAAKGYNVFSTDISRNILRVGKSVGDKNGFEMFYMAQNAELPLPFEDNTFDVVYSNCTANHISDWRTYWGEKIRVAKPRGIIYERMPNGELKWFWDQQTLLNNAVEIKALICNRDYVRKSLSIYPDIDYKVWTHDRIYEIVPNSFWFQLWRQYSKETFMPPMSWRYKRKAAQEDKMMSMDDPDGIYTIARIMKRETP